MAISFLSKKRPARQTTYQTGNRLPVYSYHSLRDIRTDEPRGGTDQAKNSSDSIRHRIVSGIGWIIVIAILIFELWLRPIPNVTVINVAGTISRSEASYQEGLRTIWGHDVFNRSKLTIQTDRLKSEILRQYPELSDAHVELPLLGQLPNVVLTPSEPAMMLVTQKGIFYLNSEGKTLARTDQVSPNSLGGLPTVRDDSGIIPETGKNGLSKQTISTITQLLRYAGSGGLEIETMVLPLVPNQVDMTVRGNNYIVKFALDQDPRQGIGALIALREKFSKENTQPASYIDVRVPDKAFYK